MTDDAGLRKPGRRRRTTRRLMRHSARVLGDAALRAAADGVRLPLSAPAGETATTVEGNGANAVERDELAVSVHESDAGDGALLEVNERQASLPPPAALIPGGDWIADSDRPGASSGSGEFDPEVKTRPKIRLPEGTVRRHSPRPPAAVSGKSIPAVPATRDGTPMPPPPDAAGRSKRPGVQPTGEGIIRGSQPAPSPNGGGRRRIADSDVPTRPRIPLTHDMALAAGRVTSLEVSEDETSDDVDDTHPRLPSLSEEMEEGDSAVLVTRSRMISDAPIGAEFDDLERRVLRPSRRVRPDSEEFEMLDLDDGDEEPARLELSEESLTGEHGLEMGVRVSRTPPPPPAQPQSKRGLAPTLQQQRGAPPPPPPGAKKPVPAPKEKEKAQPKRRAWWEVLFSDDYVRTLPRPSPALVAKQVGFMEASLGISRGDAVLDVGCGLGQHALEFARRGYLVVALDLALSMITRAAEEAQQNNLRINFLHKDIRDIGFEGTFDAVVCVGTTFGFFDDEQNRGVLLRLAHALKPGGRLLLDVVNRDYVLASQPNLVWFEGDGCVVMEESDFNYYTSRLSVKRTMMREDGRQTESDYSVRLYSVHELGQMLKQAGFGIKEVSGQEATRGLFFGSHSSRIIMLAERRASGRSNSGPPESE